MIESHMPDPKTRQAQPPAKQGLNFKSVTWWILLSMAVVVVPAIAYTVTLFLSVSGGGYVLIFIVACWLCVLLGIKLMKTPRINAIIFENVSVSESTKNRCSFMVTMIEREVVLWKKRYEHCETIFMNLSKQPAWSYLDEIVAVLSDIKRDVEQHSHVTFENINTLHGWIESAKPKVVEGYLQSLGAAYGYAKAEYAQQGKNIEEIFPELGRGDIDNFVKAPSYAVNYARELWNSLEKEHPMIARSVVKIPFDKVA